MDTFDYFRQLSAIPRESGNEEGVRNFLLAWAEANSINAITDKTGNVIMYKEATKGFEDIPAVALQGHMDMVCVRTPESNHDFTKDPIEIVVDGDFIRAKDTSLGGDNGIAIAMIMAIFTDPSAQHGPLEAIFTISEETGLTGAFGLDPFNIKAKKLINLDSEEEGVIYIGCAGGDEIDGTMKILEEETPSSLTALSIKTAGLKGGHSGAEIHMQRLNALKAVARVLFHLGKACDYRLSSFTGGTRRNVIPFSAEAVICLKKEDLEKAKTIIKEQEKIIGFENETEEPNFKLLVSETTRPETVISKKDSENIVLAVFSAPHGVYSMSKVLNNVVETSNNLALLTKKGNKVTIVTSIRSNINSAKKNLANVIEVGLENFGFNCFLNGDYPAWTPNPKSELAKFCAQAWKESTGKDAVVTAIHAGLECGIISSIIDGMDSVSMGPNLFDVHSVNEHLSISSTKRMYSFLKELLSIIK